MVLLSGPTSRTNDAPHKQRRSRLQSNNEKRKNQNEKKQEQSHLLFHLVAAISCAAISELGAWRAAPLMERWFYHGASTHQSGIQKTMQLRVLLLLLLLLVLRCPKVQRNRQQDVRKSPKRNMKRIPTHVTPICIFIPRTDDMLTTTTTTINTSHERTYHSKLYQVYVLPRNIVDTAHN